MVSPEENDHVPLAALARPEEVPDLAILQAPVTVGRFPVEGGTQYTVEIDHPPLKGKDFYALLSAVRPHKRPASPIGIMADWELPDDAPSGRLVRLHQHLGSAWEGFMASRPAFMDVMQDNIGPRTWQWRSQGISVGEIRHVIVPEPLVTPDHILRSTLRGEGPFSLEPLLGKAGLSDPRQFLLNGLSVALNRTRNPRRQLEKQRSIIRQFYALNSRRQKSVLAGIPEALTDIQRDRFVALAKQALFGSFKGEDDVQYFGFNTLIEGSLEAQAAKAETVRVEKFAAKTFTLSYRDNPRHSFTRKKVFVPGSVKRVAPEASIRPLISWIKRDDGEREFVIGGPADDGNSNYADSVLGVLTVAYLAPEVRADPRVWKDSMPIQGSPSQDIQEAQVPVLALFPAVQRKLLESQFITEAEKMAVRI